MEQPPPPLTDIAEETPSGTVSRSASNPTLYNIDTTAVAHEDVHKHQPPPSATATSPARRRNSSVSHVDLEFFDPSGVQELRRTMTQDKQKQEEEDRRSSESSDATINVGDRDGPFDFEKTLKQIIRKSAYLYFYFWS